MAIMRKKKSKQVLTCGNGDFEKSLKGKSKEEIDREMDAYFTEHPFSGDSSKII